MIRAEWTHLGHTLGLKDTVMTDWREKGTKCREMNIGIETETKQRHDYIFIFRSIVCKIRKYVHIDLSRTKRKGGMRMLSSYG